MDRKNGLAASTINKEVNILGATRKAFGKLDGTPRSLEERLNRLRDTELGLVLQTAQFVKIAHSFLYTSKETYLELTQSMYPKLSYHLQILIADVLEDAEPNNEYTS